jgi:hypothetical protein
LAVIQRSAFCDEGSLFDLSHTQPATRVALPNYFE